MSLRRAGRSALLMCSSTNVLKQMVFDDAAVMNYEVLRFHLQIQYEQNKIKTLKSVTASPLSVLSLHVLRVNHVHGFTV